MKKRLFLTLVTTISIISGCIGPLPPGPNDPYIEGPTHIRINEEAVYRIKNLKEDTNIAEIKWILITVDNPEYYYSLGNGIECKIIITEEMIQKTYIRKCFGLIVYYKEDEKTHSVEKYIFVLEKTE